jgi:two-component system KDP operon response regulator KdpE
MSENGARILIIDDERAIRRFFNTILQAHGYEVFGANDCEEGLQGVA